MKTANSTFGSYGYRFSDRKLQKTAQIWSLGWDEQKTTLYDWDGRNRRDTGKYIFQYTISGQGAIEIDGKLFQLSPGQAFIVNIPGDYRYFLPEKSDGWEFIYLTLYGDVVGDYWNEIQEDIGHILNFEPDSEPVTFLLHLLDLAASRQISNAHLASGYAYQFTMELMKYCQNIDRKLSSWPEPITQAAMYARNHYAEEIGPDEMALASGMSRYHFTRQFKEITHMTPIQYLTDIRIQKAKELLQNTKYSSEDIAQLIGYNNANYFNKVFKKVVGISPGKYRK
ncbi:AraC family transcriptional regulator [Halobacillus yeomjeoni]|uniref:AraC family transcriptional regulator n=1 Tax=Halobacillus yeomjeoni TaxID=311194 RepID=UPI001CD6DAB1|nr:AraC family transcriptional regulator [Halobacillus yeomjeoni]MCA0985267.1 AraC family transcriptional regulator [Halobacillus yeomjeoni]